MQPSLFGEPPPPADIHVWGKCPGCGYVWHLATIVPGTWWAAGATPENSRARCYCPKCEHKPPMLATEAPK